MPFLPKEFKDRHLYRTAVGYAVAAWLLLQVAAIVLPAWNAPGWIIKALIAAILFGFFVAVLIGWKRERSVGNVPNAVSQRKQLVLAAISLVPAILVALGFLLFYHPTPREKSPDQRASPKSVAVLPFANLSANQENAFFADGMQDEILTNLAKIADLKVISRTSVQQYRSGLARNIRDIAQALGVAFVLEGSVQRAGDKIRVTAQLIDARNDSHLWAEHFDGELTDVFGIQTQIAQAIADQLQVRLSPLEKTAISHVPTRDPLAHDFYLRANQLLYQVLAEYSHGKEKLTEALELFDKATARDPNFVLAYCRASQAHIALYWLDLDHTPQRLSLADEALKKAEQIQPDSDETHFARAWYFFQGLRDYERARQELNLAQRSLPNNAELFGLAGAIDRRQGRWQQSTRELQRAVELDPGTEFTLQQLAVSYHVLRRYHDEEEIYNRALILFPQDKSIPVYLARIAFDSQADTRPLRETIDRLIEQDIKSAEEFPNSLLEQALCDRDRAAAERAIKITRPGELIFFFATPAEFTEGLVALCFGDKTRAEIAFNRARTKQEEIVRQQPGYASAVSVLGLIDAGLGRKEDAIREGERACQLTPLKDDVVDGAELLINLALIYTWTGEKNRAFQQLTTLSRIPTNLSYGLLKLDPQWDLLRADPRFEQLLARMKNEPDL